MLFDYGDKTVLIKKETAKAWQRTAQVKKYEIVRLILCDFNTTAVETEHIFVRNTINTEASSSSHNNHRNSNNNTECTCTWDWVPYFTCNLIYSPLHSNPGGRRYCPTLQMRKL